MLKLILIVFFVFTFCNSSWGKTRDKTICEDLRTSPVVETHNYPINKILMRTRLWTPTCNVETGHFEPSLQCGNAEIPLCACFNETSLITDFQFGIRTCVCPLMREIAKQNGTEEECDDPFCSYSGLFRRKMCCSDSPDFQGPCFCQDETTGERTDRGDRDLECDWPEVVSVPLTTSFWHSITG